MTTLDPVILFFLFGLVAGLLRSELKLPGALYESLTIFLLLAIGLKGGQGLATQALLPLLPQIAAVIVLGCLQTLLAFAALPPDDPELLLPALPDAPPHPANAVTTSAATPAFLTVPMRNDHPCSKRTPHRE